MATAQMPLPLPDTLRFQCGACESTLEVPQAYAGITGPCPYCGNEITAPSFGGTVQATPAPEPRPPEPVPEGRPAPPVPPPIPRQPPVSSGLQEVLERSSFEEGASHPSKHQEEEASFEEEGSDEEVEAQGSSRRSRHKGERRKIVGLGHWHSRILGWGSIALFLAAGTTAYFCLRYSEPVAPPTKDVPVPKDLTAQVLWQKDRMAERKEKAINQAVECVRKFLASGNAGDTVELLKTVQPAPPKLPHPLFPDIKPEELTSSNAVRKRGSDDFVTTVEPADGRGPIFIVEQDGEVSRIHADALAQQVENKLNAFLTSTVAPPLMAYAMVRPFRGQYPISDLESWPKLDVMPPFPTTEPRAFVACARPGTAVARMITQRDPGYQWSRAVVEIRWSRTPDGREFIEIADVLPNAWARSFGSESP